MPARTNDFQQLVALIESSLAPQRAKVTESAMLEVVGLSEPREIDVLIECPEPFRIKIAYEAKDHSRPLSLNQVEEILGKYQSNTPVPVDKFVIVSASGFTRGAKEKAAADDVELLTLEEAHGKDWAAVRSRPQSIWRPQLTGFALGPKWDNVDLRLAYEKGHLICSHGNYHGTPVEYAKAAFRRWSTGAQAGRENFAGESSSTSHRVALELSGWRLCLDGSEYPVSSMVLNVDIAVQNDFAVHKTFERRSTKAESKTIHHIDGPLGEMVFSQCPPIVKRHPPGSTRRPPTKEELIEAIRSAFPDGITIKLPDLPSATFKFDGCRESFKPGDSKISDESDENPTGVD